MKVLILASWAESLINFRGALIAAIQERGHKVHVAAPGLKKGDAIRQALEANGVIVHDVYLDRTGINPTADFRTILALIKVMRKIRPDVLLAYTIKPVIYGTLAASLVGVPHRYVLITGLGYAFTEKAQGLGRLVRVVVTQLYRAALVRVNKVFFQNPDDRALFRELGIINQKVESVVVNGSGVDVCQFQPSPLPTAPLRFLLIARLLGSKGIREYAAAAKKLRKKHQDLRFDVAGWFDDNPDAISKREFNQWVQEGTLNYLGKLADVRPAIASCSVYVLPSYREGTPKTILEAMAMGRPIITTDAPGCRETVVDEKNGFLVPIKSIDALEAAMLKFVDNPSIVETMGMVSREYAEKKYDVNMINLTMILEMELV